MWSLGIGVWWSTAASLISSLLSKLKTRSTYFENKACTKATLKEIDSAELLEKASIITTPTAYSDGVLHSVKPEQTLGSELVTNGDFATDSDWNKETGWIISNNTAISDGSNTSGIIISQTIQLVEGKTYQVIVDVDSVDSGRVRFYSNFLGSGGQADIASSGTFTYNLTSTITAGRTIGIQARDAGNQSVINSISVKELINADFTFTRNNPGTRVNASGNIESIAGDLPRIDYRGFSYQDILGSELVTDGGFATNNEWTLESGWGISNGELVGTLSNATNAYQEKTLEAGKKYKITYEITNYTQGSVRFQFVGGSTVNGLTRNSLGAYTEYLTATDNHNRIRFRSLTADGGFTGSIDNVSVKEVIRQEVVPNSGCGSWLLEPEATNTATDSNDFTAGYMFETTTGNPSLVNAILTSAQTTSPDGTNNAWKFVDDNNGGTNACYIPYFSQRVIVDNYNTVSLFVKKQGDNDWFYISLAGWGVEANGNTWFDIANGTLGNVNSNHTASIIDYGNGWYRCSITFQATTDLQGSIQFRLATSNGGENILRDGTNGVYIYGLQAESHATRQYATSYIPTSGSPQTRGEDSATDAGSSDLINSTEGVFYAELKSIAEYTDASGISISNGTAQSRINIFKTSTNNKLLIQVRAQNNSINFGYTSDTTNVDFDKVAVKWKSGDYAIWINGVEVATSTSTILPIGLNRVNFNGYTTNFQPFQGNIKCIAVYKEALTDAELTCLTTI